jgi:uncharacterized membrane protein YkoI
MKRIVIPALIAMFVASPVMADIDDIQQMEAVAKQFGFISPEEARTKALAAKQGVITDFELDDRDFGGGWDYEFEIHDANGNEWDVYIDAKTGAVRKVTRDWF